MNNLSPSSECLCLCSSDMMGMWGNCGESVFVNTDILDNEIEQNEIAENDIFIQLNCELLE